MLIITGLGRCGTSFVALFLQKMGYDLGDQITWNEEMRAGLEWKKAYGLNISLSNFIDKQGKIPEEYTEEMEQKILKLDKIVFKDPRFTWHPKIIEFWYDTRKDIQILLLHRDPIADIVKSRKKLIKESRQDPRRGDDIIQFRNDILNIPQSLLNTILGKLM